MCDRKACSHSPDLLASDFFVTTERYFDGVATNFNFRIAFNRREIGEPIAKTLR
jgi:hypothetical protein